MSNELDYFLALKRIATYLDPEKLKRKAWKSWAMEPAEALEKTYRNVLQEARAAVKRKRRPKG